MDLIKREEVLELLQKLKIKYLDDLETPSHVCARVWYELNEIQKQILNLGRK